MTGDLEALQLTLAGEHAAVHVYGVLGGRAALLRPRSLRTDLARAYDAHVTRRDDLRRMVTALGAVPVASEPSYALPRELSTRSQISAEALRTERACLEQYAALVAAAGPGVSRSWAVAALGESALTQLGFGGPAQALPGVTPSADALSRSSPPSASSS